MGIITFKETRLVFPYKQAFAALFWGTFSQNVL
jgi:hypothetical protein